MTGAALPLPLLPRQSHRAITPDYANNNFHRKTCGQVLVVAVGSQFNPECVYSRVTIKSPNVENLFL